MKLVIATRLHLGRASTPPPEKNTKKIVANLKKIADNNDLAKEYDTEVLIAVVNLIFFISPGLTALSVRSLKILLVRLNLIQSLQVRKYFICFNIFFSFISSHFIIGKVQPY